MPLDPVHTARDILEMCRDHGFAAAGIADAAPTRWREELVAWLEAGKHGTMAYLKDHLEARLDPNLILPGARSAIMVADLYAARGDDDQHPAPHAPPRGRIARYARGRDYHTVMKKRLHRIADALRELAPDHHFRAFVDTAPILEREYAARAGLGWIGKHTLLIHPRLGSYTLLGGILTTLPLQALPDQPQVTDHCGTCTRCIDACPTQAITPYSVDATRCISYLTIERRAPIPPEHHGPVGDWMYGCDICQEVCPHNSPRPAPLPAGPHPAYTPRAAALDLLEVLNWTPEDRARAFHRSAMKRATLPMMKRNAVIVAANLACQNGPHAGALRARLAEIAHDQTEPELVRHTAAACLTRLQDAQTASPDCSGEPPAAPL